VVFTEDGTQPIGDLSKRCLHLYGVEDGLDHIGVRARRLVQPVEGGGDSVVVALAPQHFELGGLALFEALGNRQHGELRSALFFFFLKTIHPDHRLFTGFDVELVTVRRLLYLTLHVPRLDRRHHAAEVVYLIDQRRRLLLEIARHRLDGEGAAERIDGIAGAVLVSEQLLRAQRRAR